MFLVNSRLGLFSVTDFSSGSKSLHLTSVVLIPKLRTQFAEFLNMVSLKRLRILFSPTCVGLRYGLNIPMLRGFSRQWRINHLRTFRLTSSDLNVNRETDLPISPVYFLEPGNQHPADLPSCVTPSQYIQVLEY